MLHVFVASVKNDMLNAEAGNMEQLHADGCVERAEEEARRPDFEKEKQDRAGKKQRTAAADGKNYFRYAPRTNTLSRSRFLCPSDFQNTRHPSESIIVQRMVKDTLHEDAGEYHEFACVFGLL